MDIKNEDIYNDPERLGGKRDGIYMSITHQEIVTGVMSGHALLVRNDAAARRDAAAAASSSSEASKTLWDEITRVIARSNKRKAPEEPANAEAGPSQRPRRDEDAADASQRPRRNADAGPSQRPRRDAARRSEASKRT